MLYYQDERVTLYHGDAMQLLPCMPVADAVISDPPYGEISLEWDRWPEGCLRVSYYQLF
jgi:site-specific DNA-methyltransferase (adenine-specific)